MCVCVCIRLLNSIMDTGETLSFIYRLSLLFLYIHVISNRELASKSFLTINPIFVFFNLMNKVHGKKFNGYFYHVYDNVICILTIIW